MNRFGVALLSFEPFRQLLYKFEVAHTHDRPNTSRSDLVLSTFASQSLLPRSGHRLSHFAVLCSARLHPYAAAPLFREHLPERATLPPYHVDPGVWLRLPCQPQRMHFPFHLVSGAPINGHPAAGLRNSPNPATVATLKYGSAPAPTAAHIPLPVNAAFGLTPTGHRGNRRPASSSSRQSAHIVRRGSRSARLHRMQSQPSSMSSPRRGRSAAGVRVSLSDEEHSPRLAVVRVSVMASRTPESGRSRSPRRSTAPASRPSTPARRGANAGPTGR